jgi:hypothetical protein
MSIKKIVFVSCLVFFGFSFFHISSAQAATLYFNNAAGDNEWSTLGNWWTDAGFTVHALSLPTVSDDVIVSESVLTNTGPAASVNTMTVNDPNGFNFVNGVNTLANIGVHIPVTVANGASFNGYSLYSGPGETGNLITGNVTFNDSTLNFFGNITGNVIFNSQSTSAGSPTSTITGDAIFNGESLSEDAITGNAIFNDTSSNIDNTSHQISGNATFNDSSSNKQGHVLGNACFALTTDPANRGTVDGTISVCPVSLPTVATLNALQIDPSFPALLGSITDTGGESAGTVGFEFGLDATYGTTSSLTGTYNRGTFAVTNAALLCGTTYHFRAFATNSAGTAHGNDATFTTDSCSAPSPATLYGIDGATGVDGHAPQLFTLDPRTGTKISTIGPLGVDFGSVAGMAFNPITGILYASTGGMGNNPKSLITVDTSTGAGTLLGTITDSTGKALILQDLAFRSDGKLYGSTAFFNFDSNLYSVDISLCGTTCPASIVVDTGIRPGGPFGLAFDKTDHLFLFPNSENSYFQINPDTGQLISQKNFVNPVGRQLSLKAAKFNENGFLFASRFNFGHPGADLVIADLCTNTFMSTGLNNPDMTFMDAIAFKIPPPSSVVIPVLTTSPASAINQTTATLGGSITDTGGANVTERGFNYGLTTAYGSNIAQTTGPFTAVPFSADISNLVCNTTYHFRSYAINSAGTGVSSDASFTTAACTPTGGGGNTGGSGTSNTSSSSSRPSGGVFHRPVSSIQTECKLGENFSTVTGLPCVLVTAPTICPAGSIFSTTTGLPCTSFQTNVVTPSNPRTIALGKTNCPITSTLRLGSRGLEVKCLQASLNISSDGIFGPKTKAAVIVFQKSRGLVPDGIFGPRSRAQWIKM